VNPLSPVGLEAPPKTLFGSLISRLLPASSFAFPEPNKVPPAGAAGGLSDPAVLGTPKRFPVAGLSPGLPNKLEVSAGF
jgi:hypothetical protein